MNKKIIAIITAVALVAVIVLVASLAACNGNTPEDENPGTSQIQLPGDSTEGTGESESSTNNGTTAEIGDPGEYNYTACNDTVYVSSSAATLRSAAYEAKGSVPQGTELARIGISDDADGYWSKVTYEGETYYVASKLLTDIKDPSEGFVDVTKTVVVNEKTGTLNIRSIPTTKGSEVIGYAIAGVEITVIAENTTSGWYKVQFVAYGGEIMTGYIASNAEYFEGAEEASTATSEATTESTVESTTDAAPEGSGK